MKTIEEKKKQIRELLAASESSFEGMEDKTTELSGIEEFMTYAEAYLEFKPIVLAFGGNMDMEYVVCTDIQYEENKKCIILTVEDEYVKSLKIHIDLTRHPISYRESILFEVQAMDLELVGDHFRFTLSVYEQSPHPTTWEEFIASLNQGA